MIKIYNDKNISDKDIFTRNTQLPDVSAQVAEIIKTVREQGDSALLQYTKSFDGAEPACIELSPQQRSQALSRIEPDFLLVLEQAAENIRFYHRRQFREGYSIKKAGGVILGQKINPLARVGLYIPGGTASYPSTVLMNCIPAKLAGVGEIIMTTPPGRDGSISDNIIAAAELAGVDRIFIVGGAQAVAAMAYGTETIPPVDKIVGPGNVFVAEAKRQVFGQVDIDMIAGPSEILVVSDARGDPVVLAADMLSQAEHDKLASAVLVTTSEKLARQVAQELENQLLTLPRQEIARASIENNGKIIITDSIDRAIEIANEIAPEHLELCLDEPFEYLDRIKNAGSIFLGRNCPEALGDYFAGTNHTLPTGGTARFSSPLSVDDFVKKSSYIFYTEEALRRDGKKIACFAEKEGLSGHARSALIRQKRREGKAE